MSTSIYGRCISEADYLMLEETARDKHEYVAGRAFAMTGATAAHNILVMNLARQLYDPVRRAGCNIFASDMKVKIESLRSLYYPDLIVTCEQLSPSAVFVTAPNLIVEVLSKSTMSVDRREKLQAYRSIASLTDYILIHQTEIRIESFRKDAEDNWQFMEFEKDSVLSLSSLPCGILQINTKDVYQGIEFSV